MDRTIMVNGIEEWPQKSQLIQRILKKIPKAVSTATDDWGKNILEKDMRLAAHEAGITEHIPPMLGIKWHTKPNGKGGILSNRPEGDYLETMSNHWVKVITSRPALLAWALRAREGAIRTKAQKVSTGKSKRFSIFVHKHPYHLRGWNKANPKFKKIYEKHLNKALSSN